MYRHSKRPFCPAPLFNKPSTLTDMPRAACQGEIAGHKAPGLLQTYRLGAWPLSLMYSAPSTAAVAFNKGVENIILVASPEEALDLRRQDKGQLCMGEVNGIRPEGFDFGHSPYELGQAGSLAGQTLIQSTQAGTVGVSAAAQADTIYLGFVCHG
ncbi:2-phosphosulfolactate phosphatase [Candidatus Entotheonellaceae bacterium PAL068K]